MIPEMTTVNFGGKIPTKLFQFRCDIEDYEKVWEIEYISELISTLKKGMVVYDIGAECGEPTVLAGNIVGGENVHIFEPNSDYLPNIKAIWDANNLKEPANCFNGYVYETSSDNVEYLKLKDVEGDIFHGCLHMNPKDDPLQTVSIDDYCKTFTPPNVVLMDTEGAELSIVRGAINTIKKYAPTFFISIHKPEYILERSKGTKEDLINLFISLGYDTIHLSTDHEEHWKFIKQ